MTKILGVDFSHWQSKVDFAKLVANDIRFAIFKAGEVPTGSKKEFTDELYRRNMTQAGIHQIISGAYYYFHPSIGASRQARHFDAVMQRDGKPDFPPVIDVEDTDQMEPVHVGDVLKAMIDALMQRGYRRPIIYSRWGFLVNQVGEPPWLKEHYLWLAQYSNQLIYKPADMSNVIMWQFTDRLKIPGIGSALDGNYWLKSEEELLALGRKPAVNVDQQPTVQPEPPVVLSPQPDPQPEPQPEEELVIIPAQTAVEPPPQQETPIIKPEPLTPDTMREPLSIPQREEAVTEELGEEEPVLSEAIPPYQPERKTSNFWDMLRRLIQVIIKSFRN